MNAQRHTPNQRPLLGTAHWINRQRGMTTLLVAAVLLIMITMVTLFTARSTLMDQKISANEYRFRQATEAAQGGLEYTMAALNQVSASQLDSDSNSQLDPLDVLTANVITEPTGTFANGTSYQVLSVTDVTPVPASPRVFDLLQIEVTGWSDDRSVQRTITQVVKYKPLLLAAPVAGLASLGNVDLGGNAGLKNEQTNINLLSGGTLTVAGGSGEVCNTINGCTTVDEAGDPTNQAYYGLIPGSDYFADMTAEDFFSSFFGSSKEDVKAMADKVFPGPTTTRADLQDYLDSNPDAAIIYVEGDYKQPSGNMTTPIYLIVDGDVDIQGASFNGLIYGTGGFSAGNVTIKGAVISEGDYKTVGTANIEYDASQFPDTTEVVGGRIRLPGTWRDW